MADNKPASAKEGTMHTAWSSHALSSVKTGTEAKAQVEGTEAQDRAVEHLLASAQRHNTVPAA